MSVKSNEKVVWSKLEAKMKGLASASNPNSPLFSRIYRIALNTSLAQIKQRVFVDGKNSQNTPFGTYSKEYYERVRTAQNNSSTRINLELTGEMRREFKLVIQGDNFGLGFDKNEGRGAYTYNVNTKEGKKSVTTSNAPNAALRAEYLAENYGEFLHYTDKELETAGKVIAKNVSEWLQS